MAAVAMMTAMNVCAQIKLTGREYHNDNIMAGVFNDVDKLVTEYKTKAVAEAEQKKGRKLTASEMKDVEKKAQEAAVKLKTVREGMKVAITANFKNDTKLVMKFDMKVSDNALKAAGISWVKRKAMKAAMAIVPKSKTFNYEIKDNLIIYNEDDEYDTLRIAANGNQLLGTYAGHSKKKFPTKFTLTRTK